MYYYINSAGQQAGPIAADQLAANGVTGETLVWKAGMSQWTKAAQVAELQSFFAPQPQQPSYQPQNQAYRPQNQAYQPQNQAYQPQNQGYQPQNQAYQPQTQSYQPQNMGGVQKKPDNNMVLAVISTICCCLPLGAYSIYCAAQVDGAFRGGKYDDAVEWSEKAKKWAIWSIVLGLIGNIIYMFTYGAGVLSQL